jgi:flagellar assembly protein FliH
MSSRLLGAEDAFEVQAIEWLPAGATGSPGPHTAIPSTAHPPSPGHREPDRTGQPDSAEQVQALQRRIQELEQGIERQVREARDQGVRTGRAEASEQARLQLEPVLARLGKATEEIAGLGRRVRAETEEDAMRLAVAIARKVLHREITVDPDALLGLVKAAMQRLNARDIHRLRLNPEDVPGLERHLTSTVPLEVVADGSLERGAVVFETARGSLDASIGTQLAEIERGFIDVLRRSRDATP